MKLASLPRCRNPVSALLGRDLKDQSFSALFAAEDRREIVTSSLTSEEMLPRSRPHRNRGRWLRAHLDCCCCRSTIRPRRLA